jgi:hypothetical protein
LLDWDLFDADLDNPGTIVAISVPCRSSAFRPVAVFGAF